MKLYLMSLNLKEAAKDKTIHEIEDNSFSI